MTSGPANRRAAAETAFREGLALHRQGRLSEAEARYHGALKLRRDHFGALHMAGIVAAMTGRAADALDLLSRAVKANPASADAQNDRGLVLAELNRPAEALAAYERSIALAPGAFATHHNRGLALRSLARPAEALASFDRAIALKPDFAEFHNERGNLLVELGRLADALAAYDAAIACRPDYAEAFSNRGNALRESGRLDEALKSQERACFLAPGAAALHVNLGMTLQALGRLESALACYDKSLALNPGYVPGYVGRGGALQELGRHEQAIDSLNTAIALNSDHAAAYNNRGNARFALGMLMEAVADYDRAIALRPAYADAFSNRGNALRGLGQTRAAMESYDAAIGVRSGHAEAHWNKGLQLLTDGNYAEGWRLFEYRKRTRTASGIRSFDQPMWTGGDEIGGKTVLLHCEQGLGDTLQFCRYAPLVVERGATVHLSAQAPLVRLLKQLEPGIIVLDMHETPEHFDFHCPLMSLPLAFGTTPQSIPSPSGYLRPDPVLVEKWGSRLGPRSRPRVGLAWSGNPAHANDRNRSIALVALKPLLELDIEWICLQTDLRDGDEALLEASGARRLLQRGQSDLADTAALAAGLDLVISVDTSVVHLAGAIGCPVWVLLPYMPDFRWMLGRDDSPWYDSARLFRQSSLGDWARVLQQVRLAIHQRFGV